LKRLLAAAALALLAGTAVPANAATPGLPEFGGQCDGVVDLGCRERPCGVDELDCGMIVCFVWVATGCVLGTG
jgi:hypothetical protein